MISRNPPLAARAPRGDLEQPELAPLQDAVAMLTADCNDLLRVSDHKHGSATILRKRYLSDSADNSHFPSTFSRLMVIGPSALPCATPA